LSIFLPYRRNPLVDTDESWVPTIPDGSAEPAHTAHTQPKMGCVAAVPEDKYYIVERFGKFQKVLKPGLNCVGIPLVSRHAGAVSRRIQQLSVYVESKTKDNVFLTVQVAVQYQVEEDKLYEAHYTLQDSSHQIRSYVYDVTRATVPTLTLEEVFESKQDIANSLQTELEAKMSVYGYRIYNSLIVDVVPVAGVKKAMNDVNTQKRLRYAAEEKAETLRIQTVKAAEGEAESRYLQGIGVARQRKAIIDGLQKSVDDFKADTNLDNKAVMDIVLITQYLTTLKELSSNKNARCVFIQESTGPEAAFLNDLRTGVMEGNAS